MVQQHRTSSKHSAKEFHTTHGSLALGAHVQRGLLLSVCLLHSILLVWNIPGPDHLNAKENQHFVGTVAARCFCTVISHTELSLHDCTPSRRDTQRLRGPRPHPDLQRTVFNNTVTPNNAVIAFYNVETPLNRGTEP